MFVPGIIEKKKRGLKMSRGEIESLISRYVAGNVPDYQMSALLMAICFQGMDEEETTALTMAMSRSGSTVDLSGVSGVKVDKHSTGGIADTTTLVLLPLAASVGVKIAKMSGRGLGHTGGTVDKLESIPGFCVDLSSEAFLSGVQEIGVAVTGQSQDLVPADKLLYALRDVTATVDSIPLIASSIMSKKIAGGADKILLDVKVGRGAFMRSFEQAEKLGQLMVGIGSLAGRETVAYVTDMDQPLGLAIGNSLEIVEALETLKGNGHDDLMDLCLEYGAEMMIMAGIIGDKTRALKALNESISSGAALKKFREMVAKQGGDVDALEDYSILPEASAVEDVMATESGYIADIDAMRLGETAMRLGAGRRRAGDTIDLGVGIVLSGKTGHRINSDEPLAKVYAKTQEHCSWARGEIQKSIKISPNPVSRRRVVLAKISQRGTVKYQAEV